MSKVPSEGSSRYTKIETARGGNGNGGHEYGTTLTVAEQDDLLEYLKTL